MTTGRGAARRGVARQHICGRVGGCCCRRWGSHCKAHVPTSWPAIIRLMQWPGVRGRGGARWRVARGEGGALGGAKCTCAAAGLQREAGDTQASGRALRVLPRLVIPTPTPTPHTNGAATTAPAHTVDHCKAHVVTRAGRLVVEHRPNDAVGVTDLTTGGTGRAGQGVAWFGPRRSAGGGTIANWACGPGSSAKPGRAAPRRAARPRARPAPPQTLPPKSGAPASRARALDEVVDHVLRGAAAAGRHALVDGGLAEEGAVVARALGGGGCGGGGEWRGRGAAQQSAGLGAGWPAHAGDAQAGSRLHPTLPARLP